MLYLHPFSKVTLVKGVLCIVNGIEMLCGEFRKDRPVFGEKKINGRRRCSAISILRQESGLVCTLPNIY